ncbi:MAG: hypothetical protein HOL07_07160 [Rhodospirillaceae bacterium]|jgi:hypothetical protein|nr:hypothetical protein [Rhodospirillaceae bacterium]MBT3932062.1 hypothetical protein [Rhodospirillaceae bacterium]MBT4772524.1 hypothetical protein [Rhodospirillaceae bacterium]MBT5358114.1 hypothetical protein [Rhodospirillaceae bacterium]MBT5769355.1 hypothetical protein [Rhodospirillaceae bacterium]
MKVTIDIDCTPEEARSFMGLPDISAAQQAVVEAWQKQAMEAMSSMDPQSLFTAWAPGGGPAGSEGWEQFQKSFWSSMTNPGATSTKK